MAPSVLGSNGEARRKTTSQTRRIGRKTVQQPQRPPVKRSNRNLRRTSPETNSGTPNIGDLEDHEDPEPQAAQVVDPTLPKDDKEREVWARKLYYALLNGPNFYQEAGAKAWEVLRSTEELYRSGPFAATVNGTPASQITEQLNAVPFAQHFDKLIRFVDEQHVQSEVIGCSAEELLMKLAEARMGTADAATESHQHHEKRADCIDLTEVKAGDYIDLTMEPSDYETSDGSDVSGDDTGCDGARFGGGFTRERREDRGRTMLEDVSIVEKAVTILPSRARTHDPDTIDAVESSGSGDDAERNLNTAVHERFEVDGLSNGSTNHRAAYFDPDPFWMVHLETMKKYSHRYR